MLIRGSKYIILIFISNPFEGFYFSTLYHYGK